LQYSTLLYDKNDGTGIVTINRSQALNSLNCEAYDELYLLFKETADDPDVRAVIITGSGNKAFVAGTDISAMVSLNSIESRLFADQIRRTCDLIYNLNKPVIAAVNGFALGGGCELALCADIRIASENARFGQPEINLAIIPGSGGTQRLQRLIGAARAKEMIFGGEIIDANIALDWGLVNRVVPIADLMNKAKEIAKKFSGKSTVILALAKRSMNDGADVGLPAALDIEEQCFAECFFTEDQKEGMQAFLEKRKPQFKNR
jgi:enoyl-CoA hydratase